MFKIDKYIKLTRHFPQFRRLRHSCKKECPPRYECKQPDELSSLDEEIEYIKKTNIPLALRPIHSKDYRIYKNIFFFVCLPLIICFYINMTYLNPEKFRRPKFLPFSYLRLRNKPYPWDPVRTLFHNPKTNALPDGYEVEVSEEEEFDPFERDK